MPITLWSVATCPCAVRIVSRTVLVGVLTFAAPLLAVAIQSSGAPLDTLGFEGYTAGALVPDVTPGTPHLGQQGWIANDQNGGTTNVEAAVVQSLVTKSGSKALRVSRAPNVDNRWAVVFGNFSYALPANQITLPSGRFILIDWDMRVSNAGGDVEDNELGPFFGIEAYDGAGTIGTLGTLGVDASNGQVVYQATGTGSLTNAGPFVNFDQWNHFAILLDFTLDKYSIFLNGTQLTSTGFVDSGLNEFTDADISALAALSNASSRAMAGTAYYDNFRVLDGIPADFDQDGDIDGADLGRWKTAYGVTTAGNVDRDGDSDGHDFLIWQQNLGVDLVTAVAAGSSVPEPGFLAIVAAAMLPQSRRWHRRAS
jgi:hypothetical protein